MLIEWDNWNDKTIVNDNILPPPPPLQSSKLATRIITKWTCISTQKQCVFSYLIVKNVSFCIKKKLGCTNIHGLKP